MVIKDQKRRSDQTGKEGKAKHDHRGPLSLLSESAHKHIGNTRAKAPVESQKSRNQCDIRGRTYDEQGVPSYARNSRTADEMVSLIEKGDYSVEDLARILSAASARLTRMTAESRPGKG